MGCLKYFLQSTPSAGRTWHWGPAYTEGRNRLATTPTILSKLAVMWAIMQSTPSASAGRTWHWSPADTGGRHRLAAATAILRKLAVMWGV